MSGGGVALALIIVIIVAVVAYFVMTQSASASGGTTSPPPGGSSPPGGTSPPGGAAACTDPNCLQCASGGAPCQQCGATYWLQQNGTCQSCGAACVNYPTGDGSTVNACNGTTGQCASVDPNCASGAVNADGSCGACAPGYYAADWAPAAAAAATPVREGFVIARRRRERLTAPASVCTACLSTLGRCVNGGSGCNPKNGHCICPPGWGGPTCATSTTAMCCTLPDGSFSMKDASACEAAGGTAEPGDCVTGCCTPGAPGRAPFLTTEGGCALAGDNGYWDPDDQSCALGCCCVNGNSYPGVTKDYCANDLAGGGTASYTWNDSDVQCASAGTWCTNGCCCTDPSTGATSVTTKQACGANQWVNDCGADDDSTCCQSADQWCQTADCCVKGQLKPGMTQSACAKAGGAWQATAASCELGCCCVGGKATPSTADACHGVFTAGDATCANAASDCKQGCCCVPPSGSQTSYTTQPGMTQAECATLKGKWSGSDPKCTATDSTCIVGCCCVDGKSTPNQTEGACQAAGGAWNQLDPTCKQAGSNCTQGCCCLKTGGQQLSKDACKGAGGKWAAGACGTSCPVPTTYYCADGATGTCAADTTTGRSEYASLAACQQGCSGAHNTYNGLCMNQWSGDVGAGPITLAPQSAPTSAIYTFEGGSASPVPCSISNNPLWYEGQTVCAYAGSSTPLGSCYTLPDLETVANGVIGVDENGDVMLNF